MRKYIGDGIAIGIMISIIVAFFFIFFYPTPKLLVTPDFGRSDAWHFSISTKYIYWEKLKNNNLPLWTGLIGGGFPLFAEGQIGALFLPNIILFKLFDFPFAYNASLVVAVLTFALGMYAIVRVLTKNVMASLLGGMTASLSGIIIPQLPHITLLQGLSLTPWIFLATYRLIKKRTTFCMVLFAIVLAQQLFAGFPQAVFISLAFSSGYLIWNCRPWKHNVMLFLAFLSAVMLGIGIAGAQLLPSIEFLTQSSVSKGFSAGEASYFSYPWVHLKTLLDPYLLGNPKVGTYPHFAAFDGSIFWENTAFVGWLPLICAFAAILLGIIISKRTSETTKSIRFFIGTLIISLFLMTGKHSPAYLLFSIWPLTLFRVPSRFIWIFAISIIVLSSFGVSYILSRIKASPHKHVRRFLIMFVLFLFSLHMVQLWNIWKSYHLVESAELWLKKPEIIDSIDTNGRIVSIGTESLHNKYFVISGWNNPAPYTKLRSTLAADSNAIWHIPNAGAYAGRNLRKKSLADGILLAETTYGDNTATISALGQKILSLQNVKTILSVYPLTAESFALTDTHIDSSVPFYVYTNSNAAPRTYIAHHAQGASTVSEAADIIRKDTFVPGSWVLVPKSLALDSKQGGNAVITHQSDQQISIDVYDNASDAILVLTDTYYPGWMATVDQKQEPIFPVNIFQQGIRIPRGNHHVEFSYKPASVIYGILISIVSIIIAIILTVYPPIVSLVHIYSTTPVPARDFSHNHAQGKPHKE